MISRFSYIDLIVRMYCSGLNNIHKKAVYSRLKSFEKKNKIGMFFVDRFLLIFRIALFPLKLKINHSLPKEIVCISDTYYDKNRMEIRKYKIKQLNDNSSYPLFEEGKLQIKSRLDFLRIFKSWCFDFLLSLLSLIDFHNYELRGISNFINEKNALLIKNPKELHIFGIPKVEKYLLSSWNGINIKKFIHFGNSPLVNKKIGYYKNTTLVTGGKRQIEEITYHTKISNMVLQDVALVNNGNSFDIFLDKFNKNERYDVGFFSEGFWMRDKNGMSIEDPEILHKYLLNKKENNMALLEKKLFNECIRVAKKNNLKLSIYLHPCEERMIKNGIDSPFLDYIDNKSVFLGEKKNGFSNIYESKIAVLTLPTSSIILDCYEINKPIICASKKLLDEYEIKTDNLDLGYNGNFYSGIQIDNLKDLKKKLEQH